MKDDSEPTPDGRGRSRRRDAAPPADSVPVSALYRELWRHAVGHRRSLVLAFVLLIASQLLKLLTPALSGQAINAIQSGASDGASRAAGLLAAILAATCASWLLHGPGRILERNVALHVRRERAAGLLQQLFSAPLSWHERQHGSETAHRVQQTTRALYDFAQSQFIYLQSATKLIGPIVALLLLSLPVGLAALAAYGGLAVVIAGFDRVLRRLAHDENGAERRYWGALSDVLGHVPAIFALRLRDGAGRLVDERLGAVSAPLRRSILFNEGKWAAVDILTQLVWMALLALYVWLQHEPGAVAGVAAGVAQAGAQAAATGAAGSAGGVADVKIGNLFMVYEYALQAGGVITAIASNFQSLTRQQADYAAAAPIEQAPSIRVVTQQPEPDPLPDPGGDPGGDPAFGAAGWRTLMLSGWRYHHAGPAERAAIDGLDLELVRGRRYALIGPSGSGKSTLLRLLAGLYVPQAGQLRVDRADGRGVPAAWSGEQARQALAGIATLVPQESELFQGTVRENLRMAATGLPDDVAEPFEDRMLQIAQAQSFVQALPGGTSANLSAGAGNLSGGQRQRLALARGLVAARDSSVLMLDEPSSALDPATEHALFTALFADLPQSLAIIVSIHRPQLLAHFDEVIVVAAGRVVAQGTAAALQGRQAEFDAFRRVSRD